MQVRARGAACHRCITLYGGLGPLSSRADAASGPHRCPPVAARSLGPPGLTGRALWLPHEQPSPMLAPDLSATHARVAAAPTCRRCRHSSLAPPLDLLPPCRVPQTTLVAKAGKGSNPKTALYVGGLESTVNEAALHAAFLPFGEIKEVGLCALLLLCSCLLSSCISHSVAAQPL